MAQNGYGIIEKGNLEFLKREFSKAKLLNVPHKSGVLTVKYPAFGPDYFYRNIFNMRKTYFFQFGGWEMPFREPTTSESISVASYDFGKIIKPKFLDSSWLQLGYTLNTQEGVFVNLPKKHGIPIGDGGTLKTRLNKARKVNGIWLGEGDFGFAPYETFNLGEQDSGDFAEGGLARVLEHTESKVATKLKEMTSKKYFENGVMVEASCGGDIGNADTNFPRIYVTCINSILNHKKLGIESDYYEGNCRGHAFGILDKTHQVYSRSREGFEGRSPYRERIVQALRFFDLEHLEKKFLEKLSGK